MQRYLSLSTQTLQSELSTPAELRPSRAGVPIKARRGLYLHVIINMHKGDTKPTSNAQLPKCLARITALNSQRHFGKPSPLEKLKPTLNTDDFKSSLTATRLIIERPSHHQTCRGQQSAVEPFFLVGGGRGRLSSSPRLSFLSCA